jgi:transcriptional regulator with XRE-family HTH domain
MTIGDKIKELRKKNDLTQEKLADYLCVSYQAVSKWETGISSPDLSLIAPLTKLLHTSADDLLGLTNEEPDARRLELEEAYKKTWNTGDLDDRMKLAKSAVSEYPGDMKYLEWLASCVNMSAHNCKDDNEFRAEQEKSVNLYKTVIEGTDDSEVKTPAISGIVMALSCLNRKEEALKYAEMYPEKPGLDKTDVISWCLRGDEKLKHEQKKVVSRLENLLGQLNSMNKLEYFKAADEIIKMMIPDRNYLYFNDFLFMSSIKQALSHTKSGNYDEAFKALHKAREYASEYDKMIEVPGIHRYTSSMLDLTEVDTEKICRTGTGSQVGNFYEWLDSKWFNPIRDRDDFKALLGKKQIRNS